MIDRVFCIKVRMSGLTAQPVGVMPLSGALPTTYPDPD